MKNKIGQYIKLLETRTIGKKINGNILRIESYEYIGKLTKYKNGTYFIKMRSCNGEPYLKTKQTSCDWKLSQDYECILLMRKSKLERILK